MKSLTYLTAAFTVTLFAGPVLAAGPGVRAGDFAIHVGGDVGVQHDDNFFRKSEASEVGPPDAITSMAAGFKLSAENRTPNKVFFRLRGDVAFRKTLGADAETAADKRDGISGVDQSLLLGLFPRSSFSVDLNEKVRFTDTPAEPGALEGFERLGFELGPDLRFRPGAGDSRAFELRLGYRFMGVRFLSEDPGADSNGDEQQGASRHESDGHEVSFLTEWKFFPKTAAFVDVSYSVLDRPVQNAEAVPDGVTIGTDMPDRNLDSNPFRMELGVRGLVTQRLSATLSGGFVHTFNAERDSFVGGIGQARLEYIIEPTLKLEGGYEFDAKGSSFSNFYKLHNVFAGAELFLLSRVTISANVAYQIYDFTQSNARYNLKREDPVLRAKAGVGYNLVDWLELAVRWKLEKNDTDFKLPTTIGDEGKLEPKDYTQQVVSFLVSVDY